VNQLEPSAAPPVEDPAVTSPVSHTAEPGAPAVDGAPPSELVPPLADGVEPRAGAPSFSKDQSNE
jgi:hypothetical protein